MSIRRLVHFVLLLEIAVVVFVMVGIFWLSISEAQVRTSNNYQIQSDSINVGGGLSTSTSYSQESTFGEIATGISDSGTYSLRAGYQQMQEIFLSLAVSGDVLMSPDLPGVTGGVANGSSTLTVLTDNPAGYQLTLVSENNPAMQNGPYSIANYDAGLEPDFAFNTSGSDAHFGYSPEGADVVNDFLDDGGVCAEGGSLDTPLACWEGPSTTPRIIASGTGGNVPSGATTTVQFRVGIGSGAGVVAGVYTATTTITALPL